ncbi:MAG: hypothetical protein Kow0092_34890 [Deferrisomatales bacterium]
MTLEEKIREVLGANDVDYQVYEHEPVYTNPAMAQALGVAEAETVKSLVLKTKEGRLIVVVLPGDKKMDWKKAAAAAGTKKVSFAKEDEVSRAVGCEVGCVPPFGHVTELPVYLDRDLTRRSHVYFNPGVHHRSFRVSSRDLKRLCNPTLL